MAVEISIGEVVAIAEKLGYEVDPGDIDAVVRVLEDQDFFDALEEALADDALGDLSERATELFEAMESGKDIDLIPDDELEDDRSPGEGDQETEDYDGRGGRGTGA